MAKTWTVQDAKARFSEFLEASLIEGPQAVTRRGIETPILLPTEQWRRLKPKNKPGLFNRFGVRILNPLEPLR